MNATIGVNTTGPSTGMCCRNASGGRWGMATTVVGIGGTSAVVTGLAAAVGVAVGDCLGISDSRRDAAASARVTGESVSSGAAGSPGVMVRVALAVAVTRGVIAGRTATRGAALLVRAESALARALGDVRAEPAC